MRFVRLVAFVVVGGLLPSCSCDHNSAGGDVDASVDAPGLDAGECAVASDCDTLHGAPPCGAWQCDSGVCDVVCPGCTDADHDGYGVDTNPGDCAGPDCDDNDSTVHDNFVRSCYGGTPGTEGVGTCVAGTQTCVAGVVGPCTGEIDPSAEACNNEDDNCNSMTDEGLGTITCGIGACQATAVACGVGGTIGTCTPGAAAANDATCDGVDDDCDGAIDENCPMCVTVAPTGNDTTATADNDTTPFGTIGGAIAWAAADNTRPRIVCVAAGAACGVTGTYAGDVTMSNGIHVYGNFESTTFTSCANSTTVIQPAAATGVLFPSTVTAPTALADVRVDRATASTTAGVTIDGAHGAQLSNVTITNTPVVSSSYGVNIVNGGIATIVRSDIFAGNGSTESIAVRVVGSQANLTDNCSSFDAQGRCNTCGANAASPQLRGRTTVGTGASYSVYLQDSPGSIVSDSAMCGGNADTAAGVRIAGDGTGVQVRGNFVFTFGAAVDGVGVWAEDCNAAAPWIVDNFRLSGNGANANTNADGVRAVGDCHPIIDSNLLIAGGGEGNSSSPNGVRCEPNQAGVSSRCVVVGNPLIQGSINGFPPNATGVRCDGGGCARIANNTIMGRGAQFSATGVLLQSSNAVLQNNVIVGGCGQTSVGVMANDSFARMENNRVGGQVPQVCAGAASPQNQLSVGLYVKAAAGGNEMDVHSNVIDGTGDGSGTAICAGAGMLLDVDATTPATVPTGIYRDNIFEAGVCPARYGVDETVGGAPGPRLFEDNDLDPRNTPTALYLDDNVNAINTAGAVDTLVGCTAPCATIAADPLFASYPVDLHIAASGSPCDNTGTPVGEPAVDFDGDARSTTAPDVGVDEN